VQRLERLLHGVSKLPDSRLLLRVEPGRATVEFPNGRTQEIRIDVSDDRYTLTSRVMGKARVEQQGLDRLAALVWDRNPTSDIVEFTFDLQSRLIGRVEQLRDTLDRQELLFAITRLAEECDRFEYVLTGRDEA
jgi:hypothetical protein